jgi:hypothetical protein
MPAATEARPVDFDLVIDKWGEAESIELYLTYNEELAVDQIADMLVALTFSHPELTIEEARALPIEEHLRIRSVDTGNSITILFFGSATIAAGLPFLPVLAGVGAVAGVAAWIIKHRKDWYEGSEAKAGAEKARQEASKARIETLKLVDEIQDPLIRAQAAAEAGVDHFKESATRYGNVTTVVLAGQRLDDAA